MQSLSKISEQEHEESPLKDIMPIKRLSVLSQPDLLSNDNDFEETLLLNEMELQSPTHLQMTINEPQGISKDQIKTLITKLKSHVQAIDKLHYWVEMAGESGKVQSESI